MQNIDCTNDQSTESYRSSNETLSKMNDYSAKEFRRLEDELEKHTKLMKDMKKDLDYIFQRLRVVRGKIQTAYPESFEQ